MVGINQNYLYYSMSRRITCLAGIIILVLGTINLQDALGQDDQLKITWDQDYYTASFTWLGRQGKYPDDLTSGEYPPPGQKPKIEIAKTWPIVAMRARWTTSTKNWPKKYRSQALDLILMFACNAELYHTIFPEVIRASHFTYPPEYIKEAEDPNAHSLADILRGKEVAYEITAKAGIGLPDYTIKTHIRMGVSQDKKTIFYADHPKYISQYLTQRVMFFAVHDAGDSLQFEVRAICLCKPRTLFKGTTLNSVEKDTRYMLERFHEKLGHAPTEETIEAFLKAIKLRKLPVDYLKKDKKT